MTTATSPRWDDSMVVTLVVAVTNQTKRSSEPGLPSVSASPQAGTQIGARDAGIPGLLGVVARAVVADAPDAVTAT